MANAACGPGSKAVDWAGGDYPAGLTGIQVAGSIVMVGWPEVFSTGQHPDETGRIVDQDREMLGADRQTGAAIV